MKNKKIFYPKVVFLHSNEDNDFYNAEIIKTFFAKDVFDFIKIINVDNNDNFSDINHEMRSMQENESLCLPGKQKEEKFNFINIVFTDENDKIKELLDKIYKATKFEDEEQENVNYYILISTEIFDKSVCDIPNGSLSQIIIQNKDAAGNQLTDEQYKENIINSLITLILIPEKQMLLNHIFNYHPSNIITMNSIIFAFPSEKYNVEIKEIINAELLIKLKDQSEVYQDKFDEITLGINIPNETRQIEINFDSKIKIPFFSFAKGRNEYISKYYDSYIKKRTSDCKDILSKLTITRSDQNRIKNLKNVDASIFLEIREALSKHFSITQIITALNNYKDKLEDSSKKGKKWFFLNRFIPPVQVSGFPFNKAVLLIFLSLGIVLPIGLNFWLNPLSLILITLVFLFWLLIVAIGMFYLNRKNKKINKLIYKDYSNSIEFCTKNPLNFILASNSYVESIVVNIISREIRHLREALMRYENVLSKKADGNQKKELDPSKVKYIKKIIHEDFNNIFENMLSEYKSQIVSEFDNPDALIYYFDKIFNSSECFTKIKQYLFEENIERINEKMSEENQLPICNGNFTEELKFVVAEKNIFDKLSPVKQFKSKRIMTSDENILALVNVGIIKRNGVVDEGK